jgi:tetratricopeptide (TPR) repeat protein
VTSAGLKSKHPRKKPEKRTLPQAGTGRFTRPWFTRPWFTRAWFTRPKKRTLVLGLVLVVATVVLYYPAIQHPFVNYDDDVYVTQNVHTQTGLNWDTVAWAFTTYDAANWHPLTWLSHASDCQLFQLDPAGHHATNVLLHALNVALLFWVLLQATGSTGRSFMVAALFALHPINVESVVWIAERKNLLSMLFFLLALGVYRWYAREPRAGRYSVVAFLFALGLMAKPQVITLPFVLLLWDYWPLRRMFADGGRAATGTEAVFPPRSFPRLLLEKLPLVALSAISAVVTMKAQRVGGGINPELSLSTRLANAAVCYARYVGKAVWPTRLAPMYPHPGNSLAKSEVFAALLFLLVVTALVIAARRHRYLPVGWLWFLGALIPMIGLVQVGRQAMADRYAYLPFIGLFIMICWGVADCVVASSRWLASRRGLTAAGADAANSHQPIGAILLATVCAGVLVALMLAAHRQIDYWGDNVTLWSHTLQVTNRNYEAEEDLGEALLEKGEQADALIHFYQATEIDPRRTLPHMHIAVYDQEHGKLQEAIEQYRKAISVSQNSSTNARAFSNMGHAYLQLGNMAQASENLQEAVRLDPHKMEIWIDLGLAKQKSGDLAGAIQAYSEGVKVKPTDVGYLLLARALQQSGHQDEAATATQRAKALSANFAGAQRVADQILGQ